MRTNTVEPSSVVKYKGKLWNVETRVGGVYQLRDKSGELRLAQRQEFTLISPPIRHVTDKPNNDIHRKAVRVIPVSADAAPGRATYTRDSSDNGYTEMRPDDFAFSPDDVMAAT